MQWGITYPKEDEKKYYSFIIIFQGSVFKLGKTPFFSSIREKKVSVEDTYLLKVLYSPWMERNWNAPLGIDTGSLLVVAGEKYFYVIYVLKPGFCDQVGGILVHILGAGYEGGRCKCLFFQLCPDILGYICYAFGIEHWIYR